MGVGGGGGQELMESNVDRLNEAVQEKTFKGNIKCRDNWDNLLEGQMSGEEDSQVVPDNKLDVRDVSE